MDYRLQNTVIRIKNPEPYKPSSLTELLAHNIEIRKNSIVADVGTGCGVLAILASKLGAKKVYAVDIDEGCRLPVKTNSRANNAGNVEFLHGSMLKPLKEKVDVIVASLPQMPSFRKIDLHRHGSIDGTKCNIVLVREASRHLKKNGTLFFSLMSLSNPTRIFNELRKKYKFSVIAARERPFERKRLDRLAKDLSKYILGLNRKNKAMLFFRDGKCYFVNYIIKAEMK